jgi:hypothetical protein
LAFASPWTVAALGNHVNAIVAPRSSEQMIFAHAGHTFGWPVAFMKRTMAFGQGTVDMLEDKSVRCNASTAKVKYAVTEFPARAFAIPNMART